MKSISISIGICLLAILSLASFTSPEPTSESSAKIRMVSYAKLNECQEYGTMNFEKRMKFKYTQMKPNSKKLYYKIKAVNISLAGKSFDIKGAKVPSAYIKEWKTFYEQDPTQPIILFVTYNLVDEKGTIRMYSTQFKLGDLERIVWE